MKDLKYNYVVFGTCDDYYRVSYDELNKYDNVKLVMDYIDSSSYLLKQIFRIHTSLAINNKITLPFKNIWNQKAFINTFSDNKPICFVFFSRNQLCNPQFIDYLKNTYPKCKCVAFWQDLVDKINVPEMELLLSEKLDLALSFDHADAVKYSLTYYPLVYSPYLIHDSEKYKSDVYFVGKAKDRLSVILGAYEKFKEAGLKCDFNITGVAKKNQKYRDDINYCSGLAYIENLKHIKGTKCMLEVMQGGGTGYTLRYAEAIMYNKKIITNNTMIKDASFYNPRLISTFSDVKDIDVLFPLCDIQNINYCCKESLYPSRMLEFIDETL